MRSFFLLISLLFISPYSFGQLQFGNGFALKVYTNFLFENTDFDFQDLVTGNTLEEVTSVSTSQFGRFTPALSIFHSSGHFSELEISFLSIKSEDFVRVAGLGDALPGKTSAFSLGIRYGFNFNFFQDGNVQPIIGLSAIPFLDISSTNPDTRALYDVTRTSFGILGQIVPRLHISLSETLLLDINAPVTVADVRLSSLSLKSTVAKSPDNKSETDVRLLPYQVHLRVGVGVLF